MKELKAPDKVAQKMTHDGAVQENLATGEVTNISGREAEADFLPFGGTGGRGGVRGGTYRSRTRGARRAKKSGEGRSGYRPGRFCRRAVPFLPPCSLLRKNGRTPDLQKYIRRTPTVAADRLDAAKEAIPKKKVLKTERVFDETAGRGKTCLRFEEVEKKPNGHLRHKPRSPVRPRKSF